MPRLKIAFFQHGNISKEKYLLPWAASPPLVGDAHMLSVATSSKLCPAWGPLHPCIRLLLPTTHGPWAARTEKPPLGVGAQPRGEVPLHRGRPSTPGGLLCMAGWEFPKQPPASMGLTFSKTVLGAFANAPSPGCLCRLLPTHVAAVFQSTQLPPAQLGPHGGFEHTGSRPPTQCRLHCAQLFSGMSFCTRVSSLAGILEPFPAQWL